jgi:hypothetical protein
MCIGVYKMFFYTYTSQDNWNKDELELNLLAIVIHRWRVNW